MTSIEDIKDIRTLPPLGCIRKRPNMYYDLENSEFGSDLIISALQHMYQECQDTYMQIISDTSVEIGFRKALDTNVRTSENTIYSRYPEEFITAIYCGKGDERTPTYQMSIINAACKEFVITVRDKHGEWKQIFKNSNRITEFETVGDTKGNHTSIFIDLDVEFFDSLGCLNLLIDPVIVGEWCSENGIDLKRDED